MPRILGCFLSSDGCDIRSQHRQGPGVRLGRRGSSDELLTCGDAPQEEAEIEATLAAHQEWVAAGRPGAVSHEEAMAELLDQ